MAQIHEIEKGDKNYHLGHVLLENMKGRQQDDVFVIDAYTKERMSVGEVLSASIRLSLAFSRLGLRPGDVLSLAGRNHVQLRLPFYAGAFSGLPVAGVDPLFKYDEIKNLFKTIRPRIAFCDLDMYEIYAKVVSDLQLDVKIVTFVGGECSLATLIDGMEASVEEFEPAIFDSATVYAWLLSTSGSTGVPKMAACKHSVILWMVHQMMDMNIMGKDLSGAIGQRPTKYGFHTSPAQWMSSFLSALMMPLMNLTILQTSKPRDIEHYVDIINTYKPSFFPVCPTLISAILYHKKLCDLTCLDNITIGGEKAYKNMLSELRRRLRADACIKQVYGQTETLGPVLGTLAGHPLGCVGTPLNNVEVKLVDPDDTKKEIFEANVTGELLVKTQLMFTEYYNNPEETANAFEDGWYKTGDLLYRDENDIYYFVDRKKMLIKFRNIQVIPLEIEEVLHTHTAVLEVGVTSVPHPIDGELPVAFVVKRPGCDVTAEALKELVAEKLSTNKELRGGVIFLDQLPKTSSEKVARHKLKEIALHSHRE